MTAPPSGSLSALQLALLASRAADQRTLLQAEPIAIVGVGCRFPAGEGRPDAADPDAFWQLLANGVDAIQEVPPSRWSLDATVNAASGGLSCFHGSFLHQVDQFDPLSFGLSPREAAAMDPQHRLVLEVAHEALESAGLAPIRLRGTRAGVYLGLCTGDYAWRQLRAAAPGRTEGLDLHFATGSSFAMAAGRLAYGLGLHGPALAIDSACSSSLVAVDLAVRGLRDRSIDLALAGGVSLLLSPETSICFARGGMLAGDGRCKTFDAAADGYVRGEGCGVVVFKRLADAVAAGDPIWAVLRGTGVNQDGASAGLTVPSGDAQAALIQATLEQAHLVGESIDVVEAHGTGTVLGDPIELKALAPIYARPERAVPLLLGSVKTNLGHLEAAAGIAGLIKAVLMVQRGAVPAHLHLRRPTPLVPWHQWAMAIPATLTPWPQSHQPRRVAVSSFGFSGTNAHVIVEQPPAEAVLPWPQLRRPDWLLLSARTREALQELVERMVPWLEQQQEQAWAAICATSRAARASGRCRLAVAAGSPAEAVAALRRLDPAEPVVVPAAPRLAWELPAGLDLQSARRAMDSWQALQVVPTALLQPQPQPSWLSQLIGDPPRLRLLLNHRADLEGGGGLQAHGYSVGLPLRDPSLQAAVELWRAGVDLDWSGLAPTEPWPRQVLPTTPFARSRCWFAEPAAVVELPGSSLDLERRWRPVAAGACQGPSGCLEHVEASELEVPLRLDETFWRRWLPRLQAWLEAPKPVHWVLHGDPDTAGAQAQAIAAMLRTWLREAGASAGGLIWAGAGAEHLEAIQQHQGRPTALAEWRWRHGQVEAVTLEPVEPEPMTAASATARTGQLPTHATYLITGGGGALGLATARWLADRGARRLVLASRRLGESGPAPSALHDLERLGCQVDVVSLDVTDAEAVWQLLAWIAAERPPLHGIVHAAGVVDDGLIRQQTPERCAAVAAAKGAGALALDAASRELAPSLQMFVTYSSIAALLGSPGQLAYAAANGALDGLMASRHRQGLPGLSINWGPWAGEGMAAGAPQRLRPIPPELALASLDRWLARQTAQAVVADLEQLGSHPLAPRCRALLSELADLPATPQTFPQRLEAAQRCVVDLLVELGGFAAADVTPATRLDALGIDSLMTVELAAAVGAGLGVNLGLGAFSHEPTVTSLAAHLLELLGHDPTAAQARPDPAELDLAAEAQLPAEIANALAGVHPRAIGGTTSPVRGPETILLTGATGFLGAFLLADQLQRHPELRVHCLVRAETAAAALARVRANLEQYGLWQPGWAGRIVALPGDLAQPGLGLDGETWRGLAMELDGILHSGAQLSYVAPYSQLKGSNVIGTCEVLRLAATRAIPLEYVSSTAVYEAAAYRNAVISETEDLTTWQGIHLGYSQSKWVSERLVLAAAAAGLPVRVYRPPLIGGHSRSGAWHAGDFLHRMMRGCLALGQAPVMPMELDLVPVDYVVAAIGALAWRPQPLGFHVHLHHPEPVFWQELLDGFIAHGAPLRPVALEPWLAALAQQPSNPLYSLQPFFSQRWGDEQLTYPELNAPGMRARPSCSRTLALLASLEVTCPRLEALIGPYSRSLLAA